MKFNVISLLAAYLVASQSFLVYAGTGKTVSTSIATGMPALRSHSGNTLHTAGTSAQSKTQIAKQTALSTAPPPPNAIFPGLLGGFMGRFGQVLNQMLGTPNPFASAAGYFVSAVQSAASDVNAFNQQAVQQVQSFAAMAQTDISSFNHMLQTNNIVNAIMLPVTNFPQFLSNAEDAATDLESRINTELSYINSQIDYITSLAVYDVSAAATDISKLLNSVYSFSQNGIEIMLGSPLLTMATMINPVIMLVGAVLAADPVKMATDYPAWQSEFSSRQSVVSKNYNSVYTLVSTGLPQAESVLLSILSQLSKFTNGLTNNLRLQEILNESLLSDSFGNQINAALAGIDGVSELPGLDAENNEMHAALQSAAYYHLYSGAATAHPNHADDEFVNIPTPTLAPRASIS